MDALFCFDLGGEFGAEFDLGLIADQGVTEFAAHRGAAGKGGQDEPQVDQSFAIHFFLSITFFWGDRLISSMTVPARAVRAWTMTAATSSGRMCWSASAPG